MGKPNLSLGVRARVYDKFGNLKTDTGWKEKNQAPLQAQIRVRTKRGKILSEGEWKPCNSFVIQFLELLYRHISQGSAGGGILAVTDVANAEKSRDESSTSFDLDIAAGDDSYGIVVGTDNTAEATTQYALIAKISHGAAGGELGYSNQSFTAPVVVGANVDLVLSRTFTNNSGGNIIIEEVGIYIEWDNTDQHMILRDLHNLTINDGDSRVIEIRLRTTVEGFVIQFLELLYRHLIQATYSVTLISGAEDNDLPDTTTFESGGQAAVGSHTRGISLGTDNTVVTNMDYDLGNDIEHGVGAGELQFASQQFTIPLVISGNVDFILTRTVTNASGNSITVNEVGIRCKGNGATVHLITRFLLNFAIADTDSATVDIRLRTTV